VSERNNEPAFAPADVGYLDFESRSAVPITAGTYRYAGAADAIILSYALGGDPTATVAVERFDDGPLRWDSLPADFHDWHDAVLAGEVVWAAWNAAFDKAIWNFSTLGFPELQACHIIDPMVQAVAAGLPADLAGAARACAAIPKDPAGAELIRLFCLAGNATPATHPVQWEQFLAYARADVEALRSVYRRTSRLSLDEWREYWAMEAVNERGIGVDLAMVTHAVRLAEEDRQRSKEYLRRVTNGAVGTVDEVAKITRWLLNVLPAEGREILTKCAEETGEDGAITKAAKFALTRSRVERLLALLESDRFCADTRYDPARGVLQTRRYGGAKTPAKFAKIVAQHVDGTLLGQYVFGGAGQTGRASSRGIQIHNLARDTLSNERAAIELLYTGGDYEQLAVCNKDPVARQLSLLIRPALISDDDNVFVWSDWSQIEARVLPWLAGNDPGALARLKLFRDVDLDPSVPDLYTRTAAAISRLPVEEITPAIRQRGKVAELALGFGGGIGALQSMSASLGVHIAEHEARATVERWRNANQWCVKFWDRLLLAAESALKAPTLTFSAGRLAYVYLPEYLGGSLMCQLPSGRCLTYRGVRYDFFEEEEDDGTVRMKHAMRFSRDRGRVQIWRGILCENAVQAVAADCLRGTLVRLEDEGYRVRLHTHDEVLVECAERAAKATAYALRGVMQRGFDWSEGLPLMSEETIAWYYSKHKEARYG
jgi:DNA polymerase